MTLTAEAPPSSPGLPKRNRGAGLARFSHKPSGGRLGGESTESHPALADLDRKRKVAQKLAAMTGSEPGSVYSDVRSDAPLEPLPQHLREAVEAKPTDVSPATTPALHVVETDSRESGPKHMRRAGWGRRALGAVAAFGTLVVAPALLGDRIMDGASKAKSAGEVPTAVAPPSPEHLTAPHPPGLDEYVANHGGGAEAGLTPPTGTTIPTPDQGPDQPGPLPPPPEA